MWKITTKFLANNVRALILLATLLLTTNAQAAAQLVMVEENGCVWCARWNDEIAPIYPKTEIGKSAPLRRIDIHQPSPDDLSFARPLRFTPTFVFVVDGVEKARLEGYPGEDFFWGLVEQMAIDHNVLTLPAT